MLQAQSPATVEDVRKASMDISCECIETIYQKNVPAPSRQFMEQAAALSDDEQALNAWLATITQDEITAHALALEALGKSAQKECTSSRIEARLKKQYPKSETLIREAKNQEWSAERINAHLENEPACATVRITMRFSQVLVQYQLWEGGKNGGLESER